MPRPHHTQPADDDVRYLVALFGTMSQRDRERLLARARVLARGAIVASPAPDRCDFCAEPRTRVYWWRLMRRCGDCRRKQQLDGTGL